MKKQDTFLILQCMLGLIVFNSCSVERFIPEDELLYTGAEIEIMNKQEVEDLKQVREEVEVVIRPEPNSKILGSRLGLLVYYKAQRENPGFINKFLNKKIGEEPVYMSEVALNEVEEIILNRLENRGFFYSSVSSSIDRNEGKKEAKAIYEIELSEPYVLENYKLDSDSLQIYQEIQNNLSQALLQPGMRFELPKLKAERERIETNLLQKGYYYFNPQFLIFEADTNQYKQKKFDLFLKLKNEVPEDAIIPYKVKKVKVYPNYVVENDSIEGDTLRLDNKTFIQTEEFFKPKRLAPYILIEEGELYNPDASRYTSRRLTSIGAYKFVNIRYDEIDSLSTDSLGILEANIFLSPKTKRSIRAELQAVTKSNDFAGPLLAFTYTNRNLFHGGEILNLSGKFGYEWQLASGDQSSLSSIQLGGEGELIFPRMLFPIPINTDTDWFKYSIPKTKILLGVNFLSRTQLYRMYSFRGTFGYTWQANRFVTHNLDPISINYVSLGKKTQEFEDILKDNPYLQNSFRQEFIAGLRYSFIYNGMVDEDAIHQFFINTNFDIAGNTIDLLSGNSGEEPQKFLNLTYAQYAKADIDFRYHWKVGSGQTIATRLFGGYGMPYGNSETMPFSKQYFSGGPYSVRAFRIRSLGPGSYSPDDSDENAFFDRSGNIRLEANLEYRFPIISYLKGAVFADAGNVWHTGDVEYLEGGQFESDFISELGIGAGIGLRVEIQSFVIRFDLAAPLHSPSLPKGERWHLGIDQPVLNFGIGYPF